MRHRHNVIVLTNNNNIVLTNNDISELPTETLNGIVVILDAVNFRQNRTHEWSKYNAKVSEKVLTLSRRGGTHDSPPAVKLQYTLMASAGQPRFGSIQK